jgi:hypothetical protein
MKPNRRLSSPRRFALGVAIAIALIGLIALAWLTHQGSNSLLIPERRATTDWHREFLDHPASHSLDIQPFTANGPDGITLDALFIRASKNPGQGDRYRAIQRLLPPSGPEGKPDQSISPPHQGTVLWLHGKDSIQFIQEGLQSHAANDVTLSPLP